MNIEEVKKKYELNSNSIILPQAQDNVEFMSQVNNSIAKVMEEFKAKHGDTKKAKIQVLLDKDINAVIVKAENY